MATPNSIEDFRKQGYSEESLKMLESEEGQLNAVYACYGSAVSRAQFFEDAVRKLLTRVTGGSLPSDRVGLGNLLSMLRKRITITDTHAWKAFHAIRKVRNTLIHRFFRNQENNLKTEEGRMEMLMELVSIESSILRATELLNGMRVAIDKTLNNRHTLDEEEIVVSLADEVAKTHLLPLVRPNVWRN